MLSCDYIGENGTSSVSDIQWAGIFRGDESYGRNHGYFAMLDSVRDIFERGKTDNSLVSKIIVDSSNLTWNCNAENLENPQQGGFANGGFHQLMRPNFFLVPHTSGAEFLLFKTLAKVSTVENGIIYGNGFSYTTAISAKNCNLCPISLPLPISPSHSGDFDNSKLEAELAKNEKKCLLVVISLTNTLAAGKTVTLSGLKKTAEIAHKHGIPVLMDASHYGPVFLSMKKQDESLKELSIAQIASEVAKYVDMIMLSGKRDAHSSIGGLICFRDKGLFHSKYTTAKNDIGVVMKELQILNFGNDSYGGISGRDLLALAVGIIQSAEYGTSQRQIAATETLAKHMMELGLPVVHPVGPSDVYIDLDEFFKGSSIGRDDLPMIGLSVELIRLFGIRAGEHGPLSMGDDCSFNFLRLCVPVDQHEDQHHMYTAKALHCMKTHRDLIPKASFAFGKDLMFRPVQGMFKLEYPKGKISQKTL
eukprot:TRINITY_DN17105_c0_g1_i1.p1 TRINITY_DN17105_c0_g1~~TRINITY_DN17105_c0_g1_i1.p1  ORF type:complete len:518 (+),score=153.82 TRINITY_DN17105_c0_g1_i1:128-1555(+)